MSQDISRRRMIAITAGAAGGAMVDGAFARHLLPSKPPIMWRGMTLGAQAQIILYHDDPDQARAGLEQCRQEISRLENLFSLYRPDSVLNLLNRDGRLFNPDFEMLEILSRSKEIGRLTDGAFDVTVQPLWQLYADHFFGTKVVSSGPDSEVIKKTNRLVDYRKISLSRRKIELDGAGMAITLNGIAQGYITDKIAGLLRQQGWTNVLINLGEIYGMGRKPDRSLWKVAIAAPADESKTLKSVPVENQAVATSGGYGTTFSRDGKYHHLFDPRSGKCTNDYKSVTVIANDATTADALSTAFCAMPLHDIERVLRAISGARALIMRRNNELVEI